MRNIKTETNKVQTGKSAAKSSKRCVFFHDIPPEFYRRIANRHSVGHLKYNGDVPMNLNWREGLSDPLYVLDRLNHAFDHLVSFLEDGDEKDDNLAGVCWNISFLMEVERMHPEVLKQVIGQCKYSGPAAAEQMKRLRK